MQEKHAPCRIINWVAGATGGCQTDRLGTVLAVGESFFGAPEVVSGEKVTSGL